MGTWLREVAKHKVNESDVELIIIHVPTPDYNNSKVPKVSNDNWARLLPRFVDGNARVLQFQHQIRIEETFSWELLLDRGVTLLDALFKHEVLQSVRSFTTNWIRADRSDSQSNSPPLVFIAEGLGGFILKNALKIADDQLPRYKFILDSIAGITFIGAPHVESESEDTTHRLLQLLRPTLKTAPKRSLPRNVLFRLSLLCQRFQQIRSPLYEGIVSGYETIETQLAAGFFGIRKTAVLVDKELARIDWSNDKEYLYPINVPVGIALQFDSTNSFRKQASLYVSKAVDTYMKITTVATQAATGSIRTPSRQQTLHQMTISSTTSMDNTSLPSSMNTRSLLERMTPTSSPSATSDLDTTSSLSPSSIHVRSHRRGNRSDLPITPPTLLSSSSESGSSFEIIPGVADFQPSTDTVNLPCFSVKPHTRNEHFWPRDDIIKAIEGALLDRPYVSLGSGVPKLLRTFVLFGLGGVGKTEIATEFVFKHREKFDAIFFVHADNRTRLADEFKQMAAKLGLQHDGDVDSARESVKQWLATPVKTKRANSNGLPRSQSRQEPDSSSSDLAKWLIVFDNSDNPEILLEFWPDGGRGTVLVTSRDPMANDLAYFGEAGIEVGSLSVEDGGSFLRFLARDNTTDSEKVSQAISSRLGGLPLAIEQISAIARRKNLSFSAFLEIYKDDTNFEFLQNQRIGRKRGYEHNIASVWALQDLPPGSLALLNVISFLDPDVIQSDILKRTLERISNPHYPKSHRAFTDDLAVLLQSSLLSSGQDGAILRIHRLVRDVTRTRMRQDGLLETYFDDVINMLWTHFPRIMRGGVGRAHKIDRWGICDQLFPHISQLRELYLSLPVGSKNIKSRDKLTDLFTEAGWYQFERTNPSEAVPVLDVAQQICEESDEDSTEQLALIFASKTWVSFLIKDHEMCFRYAKDRLQYEETLFERTGKVTANFASAYNDLAATYSMNGLSSKAFPLIYKSKELRESLPGFKPEHNLSPLHQLGLAHWHQGEFQKAIDVLLLALGEREAALGVDDRTSIRTGELFYALGNVRASQDIMDESFYWHQRALSHYRATGGDGHFRTALACFRVAEHHIRFCQFTLARSLPDQALKVFEPRVHFQQEYSRTCFLYAYLDRIEGNRLHAEEMLERSVRAFNLGFPKFSRTKNDLTFADFEALCQHDF